ncbi:MAG: hypothetical protein ACE15F_17950 [bacterium]
MLRRWIRWVLFICAALLGIGAAGVGLLSYLYLSTFTPHYVSVTGCVRDASGHLLPGVEIRAVPLPIWIPIQEDPVDPVDKREITAFTRTDGWYRLEGVAAAWAGGKDAAGCQEYDLTAHAPDYAPGLIRVRPKRGGLRNVDFVLEKKSSLAGRAVDTRGCPAAGRSIKLVYRDPQSTDLGIQQNRLPPAGTTDGQGHFQFDQIPPGTYFLEIEAFPGQSLGITQRPLCDPLRVKTGEKIENLVFPVEAAEDRGSLAGQVVEASSGLPLERFSYKIPSVELAGPGSAVHGLIRADGTFQPVYPHTELSGTHGRIALESISSGAATLEISAEGYAREKVRVNIQSGRISEVTIPLDPESVLYGPVTMNNKPCAYGYVFLHRDGDPPDLETYTQTDVNGYYEFKGLKQGSYTLRITVWLKEEAPHSAQLTERFKVGVETGQRIRKNIDFTRNATLRGSFTAPDPNLSWRVEVLDASPPALGMPERERGRAIAWKVEFSGNYSFENLAPGTYEVTASCNRAAKSGGWIPVMKKTRTVSIGNGETAVLDFVFP